MNNDIQLNVLWIEDIKSLHEVYATEAEDFNLILKPYTCWEDAEKDLIEQFDNWDAIILDAKCKYRRNDPDKAERFLPQVFTKLSTLYKEKRHTIPWYILSAGGAEVGPIEDLIVDERLEWDYGWEKKYYSKNVDRETLYKRIIEQHKASDSLHLKTILHPALFKAIQDIPLHPDVSQIMVELLKPIYFNLPNENYKDQFYKTRKVLEHIIRSMVEYGILPPSALKKSEKGDINLTKVSFFLSGNDEKIPEWTCRKTVFSRVVSTMFKNILQMTGSQVHTSAKSPKDVMFVDEHLKETNYSPYLLNSLTFQVADIIIWYHDYISKNPDKDENKNWWEENFIK